MFGKKNIDWTELSSLIVIDAANLEHSVILLGRFLQNRHLIDSILRSFLLSGIRDI